MIAPPQLLPTIFALNKFEAIVPCLAIHITELTTILESNSDYLSDGLHLFNVEKAALLSRTLLLLSKMQPHPGSNSMRYKLSPVRHIIAMMHASISGHCNLSTSADSAYLKLLTDLSKQLEPTTTTTSSSVTVAAASPNIHNVSIKQQQHPYNNSGGNNKDTTDGRALTIIPKRRRRHSKSKATNTSRAGNKVSTPTRNNKSPSGGSNIISSIAEEEEEEEGASGSDGSSDSNSEEGSRSSDPAHTVNSYDNSSGGGGRPTSPSMRILAKPLKLIRAMSNFRLNVASPN